ncbi:hypothetical protein [Methylobacterium thuringiense]|uniref:Uncharacterized protein n=1 Tax=Methylobacterium thuringiense TaxID=1003091 RepID=A0ABQ4TTL4_9HYPH|nr:hypothetical protein [Methylobacterium thuringiense]GJE57754.1 hypothetical protein EKPJFOCH_4272 [Methylobacterium thuringiense]
MSIVDLRRRLERIESARHVGAPISVMADYPIEDDEADAALANWRVRVAQGRASAPNGVLYLTERSEMSEAEWADRHVTEQ